MKNSTGERRRANPVWPVLAGVAALSALLAVMLRGKDIALLNPKGYVAQGEFYLIVFTMAVLLVIAFPTIALLYYFAWKYRDTNDATYDPQAKPNKIFTASMWVVPSVFMLILGLVLWPATHKYEPKKAIPVDSKPLTIQVVAMRWKWLFIYPEQNIATVNFVQMPVNRPVEFQLSADETPMSSFWIPHLSGQLYAMTGHVNRLNVIADAVGDYPGSTAEINGAGFAGMRFTARVSDEGSFDDWVKEVQSSPNSLSSDEYAKLLKPSENNPEASYAKTDPELYAKMLMKYAGSHDHQPEKYEAGH